jgi:hypothetical protein
MKQVKKQPTTTIVAGVSDVASKFDEVSRVKTTNNDPCPYAHIYCPEMDACPFSYPTFNGKRN